MDRLIVKLNETLKDLLKQKGQGLTEFVLVLAFCAIIGWAASKVGFLDAIGSAFDFTKKPEYIPAAMGGGGGARTLRLTRPPRLTRLIHPLPRQLHRSLRA